MVCPHTAVHGGLAAGMGVQCSRYVSLAVQVFELPTVLAYPLFYKLVAPESSVVRKDAILHWMSSKQVRICVRASFQVSRLSHI